MTSSFEAPNERAVFIVELTTHEGRVCERYETYAEARKRVEQFPADSLVGLAFIFEELADGSERLVREDGKPLQFHRLLVEEARECPDEPVPLMEDIDDRPGLEGKIRVVERRPAEEWDDLPPLFASNEGGARTEAEPRMNTDETRIEQQQAPEEQTPNRSPI